MKTGRRRFIPLFCLLLLTFLAGGKPTNPTGRNIQNPQVVDTELWDGNQISTWHRNNGAIVDHNVTGDSGFEWPKGSGNSAIFASGLFIAGYIGDNLRTACAEYTREYVPGPFGSDPNGPSNKIYRIYKAEIDALQAGLEIASFDLDNDGTAEIVQLPTTDFINWPAGDGAPFIDVDADGIYDYTVDYPDILGDQFHWYVMNDGNPDIHTGLYATSPLNIEVQVSIFGFDGTQHDPLSNTVFARYVIINRGATQIDSTFISLWHDDDLGDANDDFVGCDIELNAGYTYNDRTDRFYGHNPPVVGSDLLQGPLVDSPGDVARLYTWDRFHSGFEYGQIISGYHIKNQTDKRVLPMTAFIKIIRGEYGDPETAEEYYNFMNGRVGITGLPYTDPNTGQPGVFVANGDPVTGTGWLDSDRHPSGDRRYMLSSGPFTMAPGEKQEIFTAITVARGTDALNSVTAYKYSNRIIQSFFDAGFNAPTMFKCPQVAVANLDKKIVLSWEANADLIESYTILDYRFQGYNIYQGESPDGPWHRLATLDKIDGIHTIIDQVLDPELGLIVTESVQFGTDAGIEHYFEITRDSLTNQNLLNYREYYFGVSAYLVNLEGAPKTLESPIQSVRAVPSETGIGTDLVTNHLDVLKVDHVEGRSDAIFQPRVIDPYQLNNHTYEISFAAVDSITTLWYLVDTDESDTVLTGVNSFPATPEYIVALSDNPYSDHAHIYPAYDMSDGLLLTSENTYLLPPREPNETVITNVDTLTPIIVFGGINPMIGNGYWTSFIGKYLTYIDGIPSMADLSRDIELRCTTDGSIATYYDPGVQAPDTIWVPFELWSAEDSTQINLAIYQTSGYRPIFETDDSTGAIKITKGIYFMPVYKPYDPDWQADPDTDSDIIGWMFWFNIERTLFDNGDIVRINFHNPIQPGVDRYRFQATGTETLTNRQTQNQLDLVNVFPNPYFGYHSEEQHSFDRRVYFTHLGVSKTTIRIFNLSGDPVRTIRTSILSEATSNRRVLWDLTNDAGKYVASGLYIVHITVEDLQGVHIGEKILKLAIFQPK